MCLSVFLLFITSAALAQTKVKQQTQMQIQAVPQDPPFLFDYVANTDFLDKMSPRVYQHYLSLQYTYRFDSNLSVGVGAQATFTSLDRQIVETQRGFAEFLPSGNFDAVYTLAPGYFSSFVRGGVVLPMDQYSRYEGYRAITYLALALNKSIHPRISIANLFSARYLFNQIDKNSDGIPNPTYSGSLNPRINMILMENLILSVGFGFKWAHLTNGGSDYAYFNKETLIYQWDSVSFFVSYQNGGYTEDGTVYLWFIDRNRQMASAGVSYAF